jgi:starch-binding outer membrane protein, SusD/RagB family
MMKKILYALLISLPFVLGGCEKNLDPEIYGNINSSIDFPVTVNDYELYMMEVYKTFTSKWEYFPIEGDETKYHMWFSVEESFFQLFDCGTDQMTVFTSWGDRFTIPSSANYTAYVNYPENQCPFNKVKEVTRMTQIIADLRKADINVEKRNQFIAEARVARAWSMYFLLYLYGPVPVILDPDLVNDYDALSDLTRPSRSIFVDTIAADFRYAANILPQEMTDYGRFNKGLALTQLMRLYMNEKNFAAAESVGREIQAMGFTLVDDYASLFTEPTERNSETIYAISCDPSGGGRPADANFNPYSYYFKPWDFTPGRGGWGNTGNAPFMVTWDFYYSFDANDERRATLIDSYYTSGDSTLYDSSNMTGAIINKYPDNSTLTFNGNDIVIARYADVMLMLAEAINENNNGPTTEAIGLVEEVRNRAGIGILAAGDVASKEAFNDALLRERGWELYFEGVRKFDLVRHGKWPEMVNAVADKDAGPDLLPIPQYALSLSDGKLTQNEGY